MKRSFIPSPIVLAKRTLLFLLFFTMIGSVKAQITTSHNQQMYRAELYNAAALGLKDDAQIYFNQRTDYLGDVVQPISFIIGGNGPAFANNRLVLGGQMTFRTQNNPSFKSSETESAFRVAYQLVDTEKHQFSLGLSSAVSTINVKYLNGNPFFPGSVARRSHIELGAGAIYQYTNDKFGLNLGTSLVNLPIAYINDDGFYRKRIATVYFNGSASYTLSDWKVEPIILVRSIFRQKSSNTIVANFGARFHYKDIVWFGGGARTRNQGGHLDIGLSPGGKLKNRLEIFGSVNIIKNMASSLEFGLGYTFGKKAKSE